MRSIEPGISRFRVWSFGPSRNDEFNRSARAIGAGDGIAAERRNLAGPHALGHARQARFLQLLVDPQGRFVCPADHGEPTQYPCECDQRWHRSILVVHLVAPPTRILAYAGFSCNWLAPGPNTAAKADPQSPNLAQIALVSRAEIRSSGSARIPSSAPSDPAPGALRPSRPDSMPLAGAITGVSTFSP